MSMRVRKTGSERRREIASAVLRIIGREGVTALSTQRLADEVGVTTGALFRHYPSVDEMLLAAVETAAGRIEGTFPEIGLPPLERLRTMAERRVDLLRREPGIAWLLRSEQAYLALPKAAVGSLRALVKRSRQFLLDALVEGVRLGEVRGDIPPSALVVPVLGTIHALIGTAGAERRAGGTGGGTPRAVLDALVVMLSPVGH